MLGGTVNFCTLAALSARERGRSFRRAAGDVSWKRRLSRRQRLYGSVATSVKLDECINCSELLTLLLRYRQSILRTAALYDINSD